MPRSHRHGPAARAFLALLFACALAVRVVVPAGWMPSDSGVAVALCNGTSGDGASVAQADLLAAALEKAPAGHQDKADGVCAFADLAQAMAAPLPPYVPAPGLAPAPVALPAPANAPAPGRGLAAPPPPPTGPPRLA